MSLRWVGNREKSTTDIGCSSSTDRSAGESSHAASPPVRFSVRFLLAAIAIIGAVLAILIAEASAGRHEYCDGYTNHLPATRRFLAATGDGFLEPIPRRDSSPIHKSVEVSFSYGGEIQNGSLGSAVMFLPIRRAMTWLPGDRADRSRPILLVRRIKLSDPVANSTLNSRLRTKLMKQPNDSLIGVGSAGLLIVYAVESSSMHPEEGLGARLVLFSFDRCNHRRHRCENPPPESSLTLRSFSRAHAGWECQRGA